MTMNGYHMHTLLTDGKSNRESFASRPPHTVSDTYVRALGEKLVYVDNGYCGVACLALSNRIIETSLAWNNFTYWLHKICFNIYVYIPCFNRHRTHEIMSNIKILNKYITPKTSLLILCLPYFVPPHISPTQGNHIPDFFHYVLLFIS